MKSLTLILWLLCATAFGATYHVRFDTGSDSNDGSSGSPFKFPPGARQATSTSASTSLADGDTVKFYGGIEHVITNGIICFSGVTYDMSGATYGSGTQAILTSTNVNRHMFIGTNLVATRWIGGMITNVGGYTEDDPVWASGTPVTSPPGGGPGVDLRRGTNCIVSGVTFSEIGQWQNDAPMEGTGSVTGSGVVIRGGQSNIVTGCEFTRMHTGISLRGETHSMGNIITNNYFHNFVNWSIQGVIPDAQGSFSGNIIRGNRFENCREFDNNNWGGTGDSPHQNYIFFYATGLSGTNRGVWTNNWIVQNTFTDDDTNAVGGTSSIYVEWGPSVTVAFNSFNTRAGPAILSFDKYKDEVDYQQVQVFNNTIYGRSRPFNNDEGQSTADSVTVFNNVFMRPTTTTSANAWNANRTNLVSDFNVFWSLVSPIGDWDVVYTGGYRDLASWQGFSLQDSNSVVSDPLFVSVVEPPSAHNLRPQSASPLLSLGGTNLFDRFTAFPPEDLDGIALPASGTWPIGAYASSSAPTSGRSPTMINRAVFGGRVTIR